MTAHSNSIVGWHWVAPLLMEDLRSLQQRLLGSEALSEEDLLLLNATLDKTAAILGFFHMPTGLEMVERCRQAQAANHHDAVLKVLWMLGNYLDAVGDVALLREPQPLAEMPEWVEARLTGLNSELRAALCDALGEDIVRLRDGMDLHPTDPTALDETDWAAIFAGVVGTLKFLAWDTWAELITQARNEWTPGQAPDALADLLVRLETWLPLKLFGPAPPAIDDVLPYTFAQDALATTMLVSVRSAKENLRSFALENRTLAKDELSLVQAALRTVDQHALADLTTSINEEVWQSQGHTAWTRYAIAALEGNLERLDGLLPWLLEDSEEWHAPPKAPLSLQTAAQELQRLGQPWVEAQGAGDTLSVLDAILAVRAAALKENEANLADMAGEAAIHVEHEEGDESVAALAVLLPQVASWLAGSNGAAEMTAANTPSNPILALQETPLNLEIPEGTSDEAQDDVMDVMSFWWPALKRPDKPQFWMAMHACGHALQMAGREEGALFLSASYSRTLDSQVVEALDGLKARLPINGELSPPTLVRLLKANLEMAQNALAQQTPRSFWRLMAEHAALLAEAEGRMEAQTR